METKLEDVKNIMHFNCRNNYYPLTNDTVIRFSVPDEKTYWNVLWPEYQPPFYTSSKIKGKSWSDLDIGDTAFNPKWNMVDKSVNRVSYNGVYEIKNSYPLNIIGRTGLRGRGILGRWGPNHAVDAIVTKWKRNNSIDIIHHTDSDKPILQFISIQRSDTKQWALPGGMIDPGETVDAALKREFKEEAVSLRSKDMLKKSNEAIEELFELGILIYRGYVDDHRNTDNAWIETVAVNFHDEQDTLVRNIELQAGDDAVNVSWQDIDSKLEMYADHIQHLYTVDKMHDAHW